MVVNTVSSTLNNGPGTEARLAMKCTLIGLPPEVAMSLRALLHRLPTRPPHRLQRRLPSRLPFRQIGRLSTVSVCKGRYIIACFSPPERKQLCGSQGRGLGSSSSASAVTASPTPPVTLKFPTTCWTALFRSSRMQRITQTQKKYEVASYLYRDAIYEVTK